MSAMREPRDRGAVIPIVAMVLPVLMIMTAFAVDLGRQHLLRRDLQANADVIALDLVRLADGRRLAEITDDDPVAYLTYVNGSFTRNGVEPVATATDLTDLVTFGTWDGSRAQPFVPVANPETEVPNAVQVSLDGVVDYFFQPGSGGSERGAVATRVNRAGFSIGSYAAAVATGGSPIFNALIGDALDLGVLGYDGLATVDLTFADIAAEMGGLTPEELFTTDVSALDVLSAAANILRAGDSNTAALTVLDTITSSTAADVLADIDLADVVRVSTGSEQAAFESQVNMLDLLAASAFLANGQTGLGVPGISVGPSGFGLTGELALIQAPATAYGEVGTVVGTSQLDGTLVLSAGTVALGNYTRNTLNSIVPGSGDVLCSLLGLLSLCGSHPVSAELVATVSLDLAAAEGTIHRIECSDEADYLGIGVASQLLTTDISVAVVLSSGEHDIGTIDLTLSNTRNAIDNGWVDFTIPPEAFNEFKPSQPPVGPLLGTTTLSGLTKLGSLLTADLDAQLDGIVTTLNSAVVTPLATALGASIASAEVAARAIDCGGPKLVA